MWPPDSPLPLQVTTEQYNESDGWTLGVGAVPIHQNVESGNRKKGCREPGITDLGITGQSGIRYNGNRYNGNRHNMVSIK